MCGICGILDFSDGGDVNAALTWSMTKTLHHRGPDHQDIYSEGPVGLGHARLSILDLSEAGHQPMYSPDGNRVLVYNGEIYNFPALRKELLDLGHRFRSRTDSEVILAAYEQWGEAAFARFEGMFAFAIWDKASEELKVVRDSFGIKPLYYSILPKGVVFGSEVKAILASGRLQPSVYAPALGEYMYYGTALGEHSLFAGVSKLQPGHALTVSARGAVSKPYINPYDLTPCQDDFETARQTTKQLIEDAVESHLISDVPVGLFLSGGIDSSTLCAYAAGKTKGKLSTYSVGFDFDKGVNELDKARLVADHFKTDHHELHVSAGNLTETLETLVQHHDEPFGDAANIPLFLLCREIKGQIKVVLQGDGGDEIFAGYRRYNILNHEGAWRTASALGLPFLRLLPKRAVVDRVRRMLETLAPNTSAMRMALLMTVETLQEPPTRVFSQSALQDIAGNDPFARYKEMAERFADQHPVQRMLFTDCNIILPDIFLEKVDKSTMAQSIEVRVPFLDRQLTKYVMSLPARYKVKRGQKKYLLREAMRGVVPDAILDGPKTGFGVPYAYWLQEPLADYMRSVLLDDTVRTWGIFDQPKLEQTINEHTSGRRNHGFLLYKLLNLTLWHRHYIARQH